MSFIPILRFCVTLYIDPDGKPGSVRYKGSVREVATEMTPDATRRITMAVTDVCAETIRDIVGGTVQEEYIVRPVPGDDADATGGG